MPSNNNSSKNSSKNSNSMSFGKGKNNMAIIVLLLLIITAAIGYYYMHQSNHNTDTFTGDSSSLKPASGEIVVALFYAPWCGHCKTFKPEFENAMTQLDGKKAVKSEIKDKTIRFAKINCDEDQNKPLAKKYGISGYPTVKIIKDDGTDIEYDGKRDSAGMEKYLLSDN